MIALDFLKNYLRSDFYDNLINSSFEIFNFLKDYLEDDNEYMDRMKDHLTSKSSEESIQRAWNFIDTDKLNLEELASVVGRTSISSIQEEAWDIYIDKVQHALRIRNKTYDEENDPIESFFVIYFNCKNEIFVSESWRLLKQFEFWDETYFDFVIKSSNPEIVIYAWRHLDSNKLDEEELF